MNPIDRLTSHMEELDRTEVHGAGVEAVMEAGRRHQRRRVATISGLSVAAVFVLAFAANAIQSAMSDTSTDVANDRELAEGDGRINWTTFESPVSNPLAAAVDGATAYLLTTAPGTRGMPWDTVPQAVFASDDGENWTHHVIDTNVRLQGLAQTGGVLYAVGTVPGVSVMNGNGHFNVLKSDDEGASWDDVEVPLAAAPPGGVATNTAWTQLSVAASDGTVVALANTRFEVDLSELVPAQFRGDAFETRPTDDGLAVVDWQAEMVCEAGVDDQGMVVEECLGGALPVGDNEAVVFRATWEQLGIDPVGVHSAELFVSDGEEFVPVEAPFVGTDGAVVVGVEDGFVLHTYQHSMTSQSRVWFSKDGRSWEELPDVPRMDYVSGIGAVDGKIVVAGTRGAQPGQPPFEFPVAVWVNGEWVDAELPVDVVGPAQMQTAEFSKYGAAVVIQPLDAEFGRDAEPIVLYSADLETWVDASVADVLAQRPGNLGAFVLAENRIDVRVDMWDGRQPSVFWSTSPRP